jgi:glycosyltransferase involved in cell wall biosynthesis
LIFSQTKRKISIFVPSMRGGGAERVMLALSEGLVKEGLDVDLVLVKAEGPYLAQVPPEVRIVDLKANRVLASLPNLISYIRRERPYAMLSTLTHANLIAIWAKCLARVPIRLVLRQCEMGSLMKPSSFKSFIFNHLRSWSYCRADKIIVVSKELGDELCKALKLPKESIQVIYNPVVSPELFRNAQSPINHPWFKSSKEPVILSAGRLSKQKDFVTLIKAFSIVRKKICCRLVILGEGEERTELEKLIKKLEIDKEVDLPGFVDNPYPYMAKASLFVLSSPSEGFPNVLVQAMAVGTPVISTDCKSGPSEILEGGKYGALVQVGDIMELANEIEKYLLNIKIINKSSNDLVQRAKVFSYESSISKYKSVLLA